MKRNRAEDCNNEEDECYVAKISKSNQDSECNITKCDPFLLQNVFENSDVSEKIFLLLDDNDLRACRLVCQSWKAQVDNPYFKIKLCKQMVCISDELQDAWVELINQGKFPLCKKWHGKYWTPLHVAAPDPNGWTPLQRAAQYGSTETFKFLAPQVENPNAPASNGWTPLHIAARDGRTEIFKFLAPQVENPNELAPNGLTPLQIATNNNHTEIVDFLSN